MQKSHNFSKTGAQWQEKLEKYNNANRPGKRLRLNSERLKLFTVTPLGQGCTYQRWHQRKANSSKFQERNSHFPSGSTSSTALDTPVLQLLSGTSIPTAGSKSSPSELGLVSYLFGFNIFSLLGRRALAASFTEELTANRAHLAIFHF